MADRHAWTAAPSAAQRARSVSAVASSCAVTAESGREELIAAHTVTEDGRMLLRPPADSVLFTAAICTPRSEPCAVLEFADVAPVPMRSRIRARLWLAGRLVREDDRLAFEPTRVALRRSNGVAVVDLQEYATAEPDPLAEAEARLLTHLADAHPDAVERLAGLVDPDCLQGAVRVRPLAVDRHGLTLRVERAGDHGDARLTFHQPAEDVAQLTERMQVLLAQAGRAACPRALQRQRTDDEW
ncbi:DUF2470 domain-containing protein [Streptomyces sp. NPDC048664]|uniref:DUF2470 domain-containing protein n=1 Tax=Streptomyces sp. NPDC048664 TaxID=3154505 RepID=UPI0034396C5E